jgi:hypothetical protein
MKNLQVFLAPDDVHAFVRNLWRTDHFRHSHDAPDGYVHHLVDLLASRPVIFFDMENPTLEWSHFTTWMGAYALRPDYTNDAVHDLYYLHEFWHGATMKYEPHISFVRWHRKMCENEMLASVHSEAFVYFQLPGLRELSFDFELWVDRYLPGGHAHSELPLPAEPSTLFEHLYSRRKAVMKSPDPFDLVEMQIHYYAMQNMQWSNLWKDHYRCVERHMASFLKTSSADPQAALASHLQWLNAKRGPDHITPFQEQAVAFANIVRANKAHQSNELLTS